VARPDEFPRATAVDLRPVLGGDAEALQHGRGHRRKGVGDALGFDLFVGDQARKAMERRPGGQL
jgi:hypothetical protein